MAGDPQAPPPGAHVAEPTSNADPRLPATLDDRAHADAAANPGVDARVPPKAFPEETEAAGGSPCPQATHQTEGEMYASRTAEDTGRPGTETGGRGAEQAASTPPVPTDGERTEGRADDTDPPEPTARNKRAHPTVPRTQRTGGTNDNQPPAAQEMEDVLALIFDEPTPAAG